MASDPEPIAVEVTYPHCRGDMKVTLLPDGRTLIGSSAGGTSMSGGTPVWLAREVVRLRQALGGVAASARSVGEVGIDPEADHWCTVAANLQHMAQEALREDGPNTGDLVLVRKDDLRVALFALEVAIATPRDQERLQPRIKAREAIYAALTAADIVSAKSMSRGE